MPLTSGERAKLEQKISALIDDFPDDAEKFIEHCDVLIDMATVAADNRRDEEQAKASE